MKIHSVCFVALVVACRTGSNASDASTTSTTEDASMQRPLPSGMLGGGAGGRDPGDAAPGGKRPPPEQRLRAVKNATTGSWVELQPAAAGDTPAKTTFEHWKQTSLFVSLDTMTLLNPAFTRAQAGFDVFAPAFLDVDALGRLRTQLADFSKTWSAIATAKEARERFPLSAVVRAIGDDEEWKRARGALVVTIDEITKLAEQCEKKKEALWVLPPH